MCLVYLLQTHCVKGGSCQCTLLTAETYCVKLGQLNNRDENK